MFVKCILSRFAQITDDIRFVWDFKGLDVTLPFRVFQVSELMLAIALVWEDQCQVTKTSTSC